MPASTRFSSTELARTEVERCLKDMEVAKAQEAQAAKEYGNAYAEATNLVVQYLEECHNGTIIRVHDKTKSVIGVFVKVAKDNWISALDENDTYRRTDLVARFIILNESDIMFGIEADPSADNTAWALRPLDESRQAFLKEH